ncbi:RagB/SusD family nutrient uptake outer membrane protein [Chitinophaga sp. OAE865]|uniref:RagB/SusD family nutrient uptake outer membrane protein n=1 Tax=Chitinophaga sp. OAE865 TaxID=2817898 RepID=UPI001AE7EAD2
MKSVVYCYIFFLLLFFPACRRQLDVVPTNNNWTDSEQQLSSFEGIMEAVNGNYMLLRNNNSALYWLNELRGNTFRMPVINPFDYLDIFSYSRDPGLLSAEDYWVGAYTLIIACNRVLEGLARFEKSKQFTDLPPANSALLLHAKGETYFLRAYTYFNLVRLFGRPYYQRPQMNPGVIVKNNTDINFIPGRSTVSEVYAQIIEDLKTADSIMAADVGRTNAFATRPAVWALLSRVYLYMGGTYDTPDKDINQQALLYANKVINAGKFQLLKGKAYDTLLYNGKYNNPETIFASIYIDVNNNLGVNTFNALLEAAPSLLQAFMEHDYRRDFFWTTISFAVTTKYGRKSAPFIHLRLAEVYLNKAEALLKMDNTTEALDAVNVIHTRAGLPPLLYSNRAQLQKDIIRERRLELCFEGHSGFDDYRNGLPMVRPAIDADTAFEVLPTDKRVVLLIPQREMDANPKMVQNEQ